MPKVKRLPDGAEALYAGELFGGDLSRLALGAGDDATTIEREIVLTGDYKDRKFQITRAHLDQMIANHARAKVDPALDREHESWFSLNQEPARGWVKSLRVEPSKMAPGREALVGSIELNDLGRGAVANKHYRYLSAGINFKTKDRLSGADIGVSLDHVALVKHPYVQGMEPLTLSAGHGADDEENDMKNLLPAVLLSLGMAAEVDEEKALTAFKKREDERKALSDRADKAEAELTKLRATGGDVVALTEKVKALETQAKLSHVIAISHEVDAAVAAFKLDPSERDEYIELGAESPERMRKMLAKRKPNPPAGEIRTAGKPRGDEQSLSAQEKAIDDEMKANPALDVAGAFSAAEKKNPVLFKRESEGV